MSPPPPDPDTHRREVRDYYRTVSRYIDSELLGRSDEGFWRAVVAEGGRPVVLELGCGTGRVTRVLADASEAVVGVDLSPEMLGRARRRLEERANAHLVLADMRTLRLKRRFPLIAVANDPFTHLVEDRDRDRALETVARHLERGGGRLILDAFWLGEKLLRRAAREEGLRREREVRRSGEADLRIREHWRCDRETRRCEVRYEYRTEGGPADRTSFRARLWSVSELRRRARRVDLEVRELWGGFDRRPFDPEDADHLIAEIVA